jgi:thiosulfate dehydrogenase (quinone) large subunit
MNFSFLISGTVSHNPTNIIMGVLIMVDGYNAGVFGLDCYGFRFSRRNWGKK